jgi:AcrR family transcriptional regulator
MAMDITKDALAEALRRLMLKRPVDRISVMDIVTLSGYSRKTFYNHFQNKEELLVWIFNEDVLDLARKYILCGNNAEHLKASVDYYDFVSRHLNRMPVQDYLDYIERRSMQLYENRRFYRNAFGLCPVR